MGHIGMRQNLNANNDYRKKVINEYYEILAKYMDFADDYIILNNKYEYTINPPKVFKQYVEFVKSENMQNNSWDELENVRQAVPNIKQLRQDGLDDYTYEKLLEYFIGKIKFLSEMLNKCWGIEITNLNDRDSVQKHADTVSLLKNNLEIPETMTSELDELLNFFNNYWSNDINSSGNGCYIATMAYGSYEHLQVLKLRKFRDEFLAKTIWGKMFIKTYYFISPKLVEVLKNQKNTNAFIRMVLNQIIKIIKP